MAAITFEFASAASLAVFALVVTPLLILAWSGGAVTLPSPITMTRRSGNCDCSAGAGMALITEAAIKTEADKSQGEAARTANVAARRDAAKATSMTVFMIVPLMPSKPVCSSFTGPMWPSADLTLAVTLSWHLSPLQLQRRNSLVRTRTEHRRRRLYGAGRFVAGAPFGVPPPLLTARAKIFVAVCKTRTPKPCENAIALPLPASARRSKARLLSSLRSAGSGLRHAAAAATCSSSDRDRSTFPGARFSTEPPIAFMAAQEGSVTETIRG